MPRHVRWQFKLEASQVLKVMVCPVDGRLRWETFYARMDESGYVTVPKLIQKLLLKIAPNQQSLTREAVPVRLEPA